jgi:hypothetical protein
MNALGIRGFNVQVRLTVAVVAGRLPGTGSPSSVVVLPEMIVHRP